VGGTKEIQRGGLVSEILEPGFELFFNRMQRTVYLTAVQHGWYEEDTFNDGEKIALMHSELSEALDALRQGDPPDSHIPEFTGVEAELADTIIRIMDYAEHKKLRLSEAILAKAAYNEKRLYKHGGKKF
jgi:NTP pyrophosphatase (non-canonical NTP hydrolase)